MKKLLLSGVLMFALVLSACQNESNMTAPTVTPTNQSSTAMKLADQLNLDNEQMGQINDMFYMNEDLSILLDDGQLFTFNQITELMGMYGENDMKRRPGAVVDMEALMYYSLIRRACPDKEQEILDQIKTLISESQKARLQIIKDNQATPDLIPDLLKAEHDKLMADIDVLIGPECIEAIAQLKADIEKKREEQRLKWVERRINAELAFLTKLLGLTQEQQDAVKILLQNRYAEMEKLRTQYQGDPEGLRAALQALQTKFEEDLLALLTPDQVELWNAFKNRKPTIDTGTVIDRQVAHYTKLLSLTEEQATALRALLEAKLAAEKAAMQNFKGDRKGLMEELRKIQATFEEGVIALLTPDQLEIWKKMNGGGGPGNGGGPRGG